MKNATIVKMQTLALVATLACSTPNTLAQKSKPAGGAKSPNAAAADAAQKSACSNLTFCYDTADFTATITQFRTSTDGSGNKIVDAIVHFKNKTSQVLSLGYADGSADGMDDHGNRFELNKNGVRGMGIVTGTTPDAKFVLQPNGAGDARFELLWNQKDQIAGATYELDLSIREMNQGDDKKWALGNETLLHYDGLANGSASAAPAASEGTSGATATASATASGSGSAGAAPAGSAVASNLASGATAAGQPCAPAAANDAVSSTTAAISSIGSLFGHKKAAPPASAATAPCAPATAKAAGSTGPAIAPIASGAAQPAAAPAPAAATPAQAAAAPAPASRAVKPAPAPQTGVVNAALKQPVATTGAAKTPAATTTTKKPAPATVPAVKKPAPVPPATPTTGQ